MSEDTDRRLEAIENKLDDLAELMERIAIQKTRLDNIEKRVDGIWSKWDKNILPMIQDCPKAQVRWLWFVVIPQGITLLVMAAAIWSKL